MTRLSYVWSGSALGATQDLLLGGVELRRRQRALAQQPLEPLQLVCDASPGSRGRRRGWGGWRLVRVGEPLVLFGLLLVACLVPLTGVVDRRTRAGQHRPAQQRPPTRNEQSHRYPSFPRGTASVDRARGSGPG